MFLAGSFHLLRASDYPLPAAYEQAWKESSQVVFEIAPGEMEKPEVRRKIGGMSLLPSGKLSDRVSAETWKTLSSWAGETGTQETMLQRFQPWMAGLTVSITAFDRMGYKSEFGMEKHFTSRLQAEGKTGIGLESAVGQITLFTTLSAGQQEDMLKQALEEVKNPDILLKTSAAWHAGDAEALHTSLHESFADFRYLEKMMLSDRNAAWIPALEKCLQGDQPTLVMVGAGHLCGPGSVVDLLEKKGYRPVRLISAGDAAAPAPAPAQAPVPSPSPAPAPPAVKKAA